MFFPRSLLVGLPLLVILPACGNGSVDDDTSATGGQGTGAVGAGGNTSGSGGDTPGSGGTTNSPAEWSIERITTWQDDATAAYTMFYDDTCNEDLDNHFDVVDPQLTDRGLRASFGAIVSLCEERGIWSNLLTLQSHGHEIASHSWSHPNLAELSMDPEALNQQFDSARATLETNLQGREVTFFIFPFDAFNDVLVERLRSQNYLGARAGDRGWNDANFADDFRIAFDVFGPGYSIYGNDDTNRANGTPCQNDYSGVDWDDASSACRQYLLDKYVDDIITAGGWGMRELHSVDGEAWEPVPLDEYIAHLDYVKSKVDAGQLWVAPASDVIRYRRAREYCSLPISSGSTLTFSPSNDCIRYATELTFVVRPLEGTVTSLTATQGAAALTVRPAGNGAFYVTANPAEGAVQLNAQ